MDTISRRNFLGNALLAGAGTTFLQKLSPLELRRAAKVPPPGVAFEDFDPNFIAGRVVENLGEGRYMVTDSDSQARVIKVAPSSRVWKQGFWNRFGLQEDDCQYSRGTLQGDGTLEIDRLWVHIFNFPGVVANVQEKRLTIQNAWSGDEFEMPVLDHTEVQTRRGDFVRGSTADLTTEELVQTVGFGDLQHGTFRPTRIIRRSRGNGPSGGEEQSSDSEPGEVTTVQEITQPDGSKKHQCQTTYFGLTSWFCCGGVLACGATCTDQHPQCKENNCGGFGGFCTGCRTDNMSLAWPNVCNGAGTDCRRTSCVSCCPSSVPEFTCQQELVAQNPCNLNAVTVRVRDHGPVIHCLGPITCKNRDTVRFDLTACAFSALGQLDWGHQALNVSYSRPC